MKRAVICSVLVVALMFPCTVSAGTVPSSGWPFCTDRDELKEFFLAMIKKDDKWMKALKTCLVAKPGLSLVTIEDYDSDSELGNVAKVRLIGENSRTSLVGFTLKLKDGPKF